MTKQVSSSIKMKVFQKGQIVIPAFLRKKYNIEIGDYLDVVPTQNGILIKTVPHDREKKTMTEKLFGIFSSHASAHEFPGKTKISAAIEEGFLEGWDE
ncbi:MAG: hypothetical protein DRG83_19655 [Deltaproteobacteria bacterium]|nr:MAG: hypothetical protein DRG83_19655 [Deltaproteobacteria bacterium]